MNFLWMLAVAFFVMWLLGFAVFHVAGGFIHVFLVLMVFVIIFRLFSGNDRG